MAESAAGEVVVRPGEGLGGKGQDAEDGRDDFRDEAALAQRLGRARPKASSLDFAERRGVDTPKPFLENARAWLEGGRERLAQAWERAEKVFAGVRERVSAGQAEEMRQGREAALRELREEFAQLARGADPAAENARRRALHEILGTGQEQSRDRETAEAERLARLRAELAQERAAKREGGEAARLEALRREFAKEKPAAKTPEEVRQAYQEQAKPAQENSRDEGRDKGGGYEFER